MLKHIEAIKKKGTTTIDCYSTCKTKRGAICELGRYIEKNYDKSEGSFLRVSNKAELEELLSIGNHSYSEWGIEIEEVGCAAIVDEDGNVLEYTDANYYLMVRFVN